MRYLCGSAVRVEVTELQHWVQIMTKTLNADTVYIGRYCIVYKYYTFSARAEIRQTQNANQTFQALKMLDRKLLYK